MAISVEQAILRMLEHTPILNSEQVPLEEAVGRSLAQNLYARYPQPPFDRSPLDGYAVRGEDLVGAAPASPAVLQVVDKLYAGSVANIPVKPGQAVRLMTGSMIPIGADCVVKQEDTDEGEAVVNVFRPVSSGSNICWEGGRISGGRFAAAWRPEGGCCRRCCSSGSGLSDADGSEKDESGYPFHWR